MVFRLLGTENNFFFFSVCVTFRLLILKHNCHYTGLEKEGGRWSIGGR